MVSYFKISAQNTLRCMPRGSCCAANFMVYQCTMWQILIDFLKFIKMEQYFIAPSQRDTFCATAQCAEIKQAMQI